MATPGSFQAGTAAVPSSQVEISVSCRHLADKDTFSKSDPMCVLKMADAKTKAFHEYGRTEMIKDTLNPEFVKKFIVSYFFEERQVLRFEIYDVDSPSAQLQSHDYLGCMECSLGEVISAPGGALTRNLQGRSSRGMITVRAEEIGACKEEVTLQFRGTHLDKKDFFGKSDPFLLFYRSNEDRSFTVVHKTEVVMNNLNPTWQTFILPARTLCRGDYDRPIKIECYDWDSDGSHDFIGECVTTLREISRGPGSTNNYDLVNPKKKAKKKSYKNSGELQLLVCRIQQVASFIDYIKGGMQMNFTVAIDFTASNGNPNNPASLHYMSPHQPNQYATAIQAVGEIIQDYDSDKMFPVLGFGAKLPDGSVSFEFPLTFNSSNPYVQGIGNVLQVYYNALRQVQLYGPTNFSPVINHVARFANSMKDGTNYFVLLIITDGIITDMDRTVEAIVNASSLPMSIIIVGVGNEDFEAMNILDADDRKLSSHGRVAERDIVQFVPFRNFVGGRAGADLQYSKAMLAKEVLAEIPDQVVAYMKKRGIKPKPPTAAPPPSAALPNAAPPPSAALPNAAPPLSGAPAAAGQGFPPPQGGPAPYPGGPGAPPQPYLGAPGAGPQGGRTSPYGAPYPSSASPNVSPRASAPPGVQGSAPAGPGGYPGQQQGYPGQQGQGYPGQQGQPQGGPPYPSQQGYPGQQGQGYPGQQGQPQGGPPYPSQQGYPGQQGRPQGGPPYPPQQGYPGQQGQSYPGQQGQPQGGPPYPPQQGYPSPAGSPRP